MASVPPENAHEYDRSRGCQSAFDTLINTFSDDPEKLALNTTLLLGLAARGSDIFDLRGNDDDYLLGNPSQQVYASLLEKIAAAGKIHSSETVIDSILVSIFEELHSRFRARSRNIPPSMPENETRKLFISELEYAVTIKRNFQEKGVPIDNPTRFLFRRLKKDILELSEDVFVESTREQADRALPIEVSRFHPEIAMQFCDKSYWQHYYASMDLAETRGDMYEWNRLSRIGRSHIRWIKDQRPQIEFMLKFNIDDN